MTKLLLLILPLVMVILMVKFMNMVLTVETDENRMTRRALSKKLKNYHAKINSLLKELKQAKINSNEP